MAIPASTFLGMIMSVDGTSAGSRLPSKRGGPDCDAEDLNEPDADRDADLLPAMESWAETSEDDIRDFET